MSNDEDITLEKSSTTYFNLPLNQFMAGMCSGVTVAGLLNPYDRALYLSVRHRRNFLDRANFKNPYRGFWQSLCGRALSGGLYFPLYDVMEKPCRKFFVTADSQPNEREKLLANWSAGTLAGSVNGFLLNSLTAVKYHSWGSDRSKVGFVVVARRMYSKGGVRPFFKGIIPTVIRDCIFGGVYATLKSIFEKILRERNLDVERNPTREGRERFVSAMLAAALATVFSAPHNFARNMAYASSPNTKAPTCRSSLRRLIHDARLNEKPYHYIQGRLRLGWGTARVAVGMALGNDLYTRANAFLQD